MRSTALDPGIPVQLRYVRLQGIAGCVIDLLASLIDSALRVHGVAIALEGEHQRAIWPQTTIPLRIIAHTQAPLDGQREVVIYRGDQITVCRMQRCRSPFVMLAQSDTSDRIAPDGNSTSPTSI